MNLEGTDRIDPRVQEVSKFKDLLPLWRNARCISTEDQMLRMEVFMDWRHPSCATAFYAFNAAVRKHLIDSDWFHLIVSAATSEDVGADWAKRGILCHLFGAPVFSPAGICMPPSEHLPTTPRIYFGHVEPDGYLAARYIELKLP